MLRAAREIAGEQAEHHVTARRQQCEQRIHAGQHAALRRAQQHGEVAQVISEQLGNPGIGLRAAVLAEKLARDAGVGAACDLDVAQVVVHAECVAHGKAQRAFAAAAAGDERAVDVEEEQGLFQCAAFVGLRGGFVKAGRGRCPFEVWS